MGTTWTSRASPTSAACSSKLEPTGDASSPEAAAEHQHERTALGDSRPPPLQGRATAPSGFSCISGDSESRRTCRTPGRSAP